MDLIAFIELLLALLLLLVPMGAEADPTHCCAKQFYAERATMDQPKDATRYGHTGKCYTAVQLDAALEANTEIVVLEQNYGLGSPYVHYPSELTAVAAAVRDYFDLTAAAGTARNRLCGGPRIDLYKSKAVCDGGTNNGQNCRLEGNPDCSGGTCAGVPIETPIGTFNNSWAFQIQNATYQTYIDDEWTHGLHMGMTNTDATWYSALDAISPDTKPIPYGNSHWANDGTDSIEWTGYVEVNICIAEYQDWFVSSVLENMRAVHSECAVGGAAKIGWMEPLPPGTDRSSKTTYCGRTNYKEPAGGMGWEGFVFNGDYCAGGANSGQKCHNDADCTGSICGGGNAGAHQCADVGGPVIPTMYAAGDYSRCANEIYAKLYIAFDTLVPADKNGYCVGGSAPWSACGADGDCAGAGTCSSFHNAKVLNENTPPLHNKGKWEWMTAANQRNPHNWGERLLTVPSPGCTFDRLNCTSAGVPNACCTGLDTGNCCPDQSVCTD